MARPENAELDVRGPGAKEVAVEGFQRSHWNRALRKVCRRKTALGALLVISVLFVLAVLAPFLANEAPYWAHLDGKDQWPVFRGLTWEDFAWLGASATLVGTLLLRWILGRFRVMRHRRRMTIALLFLGFGLTAFLAHGARPANLASFDFAGRAREAGVEMVWPPIAHGYQDIDARLLPPGSSGHPLGTDADGRDVAARLLYGARVSLTVGFVVVTLSTVLGMMLGGLAGYFRGGVDAALSWLIQVFMCFPVLFSVLALQAFVRPSLLWILLLLGLTRWTGVARLVRSEVLRLREMPFVMAAKALGVTRCRILFGHVLPNAMAPVLVSATFGIAGAILLESTLSFLGLGAPPPTPSWGEIMAGGRDHAKTSSHLVVLPGIAIFVTVVSYNLLGEALRDALDPRIGTDEP